MASTNTVDHGSTDNVEPLHKLSPHHNIPSVAIQKRWYLQGIIETTVHLLAIGASVAIITICACDTYFKDVQAHNINLYLQIFQFVAKVHDILVVFSLSEIVLYYLLHDLCNEDGLPLGYLLAPFQLSMPLSLFQKEYRAALPHMKRLGEKWSSRDWRTVRFASLVFFATIITAIISPLSAILIVPQLRWWDVPHDVAFAHVNGTYKPESGFLYWNASYEVLFPSSFDSSVVPLPDNCWGWDCPYYNTPDMYQFGRDYQKYDVTANIVAQEEANAARYLAGGNNKTTFAKGYTVSSTPMSGLTRNHATLWLFAKRRSMKLAGIGRPVFTLRSKDRNRPLMRPLVQTQCGKPVDISQGGQVRANFPIDQIKLKEDELPLVGPIERSINVSYHIQGFQDYPGMTGPRVSFVNLSADPAKPLVGILYSATFFSTSGKPQPYPNMTGMSFNSDDGSYLAARALFPCTLVSHWVPSATQLEPRAGNIVSTVERVNPIDWTNSTFLSDRARPIALDIGFMDAVNAPAPVSPNNNLTVYEYEFSALGVDVYQSYWFDSDWSDRWPALVSTMASLQTADALARYYHYADMFMWFAGPVNNFSNNLMDLNNPTYAFKDAANQRIFGNKQEIRDHPELYTELEITVQRFGYAWSLGHGWRWNSDAFKRFALFVVLLHSILVIAHHLAILIRCLRGQNWICKTWWTPLSIVLLALQTPVGLVTRIRGTSTGVEDGETYRDVVKIREGDFQADLASRELVQTKNVVLTISAPGELGSVSKKTAYRKAGRTSYSNDENIELGEGDQTPMINSGEERRQKLRPDMKYY